MSNGGFKVLATDHTGFTVKSVDEAAAFWTEIFGFELLRKGEMPGGAFLGNVCGVSEHGLRIALLQAPGHQIELLEYFGDSPTGEVDFDNAATGAAHICLHVDNLSAALDKLTQHGWRTYGEPQTLASGPRAGTRVLYVNGPDNIKIELMQLPG